MSLSPIISLQRCIIVTDPQFPSRSPTKCFNVCNYQKPGKGTPEEFICFRLNTAMQNARNQECGMPMTVAARSKA
jgi:hypothetical protein